MSKYIFPIESERLYFEHFSLDHLEQKKAFFVDNPNLHFVGITDPKSPEEEAKVWIERQIQRYEETGFGMLAAISKEDGSLVGCCGIIFRENIPGNTGYEIGYSILPSLWGKGYASELSQSMRKYFEDQKIAEEVISIIHIDNIASQKVAEKNKMTRETQFDFLGSPCYLYKYKL